MTFAENEAKTAHLRMKPMPVGTRVVLSYSPGAYTGRVGTVISKSFIGRAGAEYQKVELEHRRTREQEVEVEDRGRPRQVVEFCVSEFEPLNPEDRLGRQSPTRRPRY